MLTLKIGIFLCLIALSATQTYNPNTQSIPSRNIPPLGAAIVDPAQAFDPVVNVAVLNKIQIIIRILKILKDLGFDIPCFIKDLIKKLPLNRLKKLLDWFLKNDVKQKIKNLWDLLKLLKKLGIPLPFHLFFVPPCRLGEMAIPNSKRPIVRGCDSRSWQRKIL